MNVCPGVAMTWTSMVPDRHQVSVGDPGPRSKATRSAAFEVIGGPGRAGQGQPAGEVVVVDVGLEHVADRDPTAGGRGQDPVDVPLRVDHEGTVPSVTR